MGADKSHVSWGYRRSMLAAELLEFSEGVCFPGSRNFDDFLRFLQGKQPARES
jgi:hypothetical protein